MQVTLLGTGAPLAPGRATLGLLVTAPDCEPLLIDTCGGFELARQLALVGQPLAAIRHVVLTHRHLDHAGGMPALFLADLPLAVYALEDTHSGLRELMGASFPEWRVHPEVTRPVVAPGERREIGGFAVEFFRVEHRVETVAVRVTRGGRTLAFSADSLPCDALVACARDADLFICDALCSALDGADRAARARQLMHPIAREAAELAARAGAGALALVHLARYADPANLQTEAAATFSGTLTVPDDGQRYTL